MEGLARDIAASELQEETARATLASVVEEVVASEAMAAVTDLQPAILERLRTEQRNAQFAATISVVQRHMMKRMMLKHLATTVVQVGVCWLGMIHEALCEGKRVCEMSVLGGYCSWLQNGHEHFLRLQLRRLAGRLMMGRLLRICRAAEDARASNQPTTVTGLIMGQLQAHIEFDVLLDLMERECEREAERIDRQDDSDCGGGVGVMQGHHDEKEKAEARGSEGVSVASVL